MPTTRRLNKSRLATLITSAVLGLGLLVGCSEQPSVGPNTAHVTQSTSNDNANIKQDEAVFAVPDMNCPTCPIAVRRALNNVDGVLQAEASLDTKQALVVFDLSLTTTDALIAAIENAGFSAYLKEDNHE